jgi:hypothetical protein
MRNFAPRARNWDLCCRAQRLWRKGVILRPRRNQPIGLYVPRVEFARLKLTK